MSDLMRQIPFGQLMTWALNEYETDETVFGIHKLYSHEPSRMRSIFGKGLELPFGVAAGPHTQLAQNLVASYAAGARFFELKTVQVLDGEDLPVSKPCIYAGDEGYNIEWSTELYVPQALDEYIKGWLAIVLLGRELGLGSDEGFVFNMSVGYDLEGIQTAKIDSFIEGLKNAGDTDYWKTCTQWAKDNLTRFKYVDKQLIDNLKPNISNSITLSTLHGCPPDEIERIATYLLREKGLHTFIKCNPTLLGYEDARSLLNKLGFDYVSFDERHFLADLQFDDAVLMLRRLKSLADSLSLEFGVKLTNTFPVQNDQNILSGEEMYMSGRALFPLSMAVANRLSKAFDGDLRISYSGGADVRNILDIARAGIWPITLATTVLKPGGYERLHQIACALSETDGEGCKEESGETGYDNFRKNDATGGFVNLIKLQELFDNTLINPMYAKPENIQKSRKIDDKVPLIDCFRAPCRDGCPFGQDVPAYLRLIGEKKYAQALRVIIEKNPLVHITGTICSHNCMTRCVRGFYDSSVDIRAEKLAAAKGAFEAVLAERIGKKGMPKSKCKIAVIGGGPAGLAAAYFLAGAGHAVTIHEEKSSLGGIVRHVIPEFRIAQSAIDKDIELVLSAGINLRLGLRVVDIEKVRAYGYEHVIIATGAWKSLSVELERGTAINAIPFLARLKKTPENVKLGENIAVIGGGNTAIDVARAVVRQKDVKKVRIIYRRTKRYMPADSEELILAQNEGVELLELLAPASHVNGVLTCNVMELGEPDESGRCSPISTGESVEIPADTIISAIGSIADNRIVDAVLAVYDKQNVHIIGDAKRGPATVAEAIADAAKCAAAIAGAEFNKYEHLNVRTNEADAIGKKGILYCNECRPDEAACCLECEAVCSLCVDVCPNRANIGVKIDGRTQIVHIDFMCNECGNCEVFCPYSSAPQFDKFTYFIYEQDFLASENPGFLAMEDGTIRVRLDGVVSDHRDDTKLPSDIWRLIEASLNKFKSWFLQEHVH
ncbi:MAG: putative selenate reductase subunit YgfK [Oscillospiraceae bacterium]|nr:putative selenate reductase subunit YgfK [Oscillospiraceae bacterium]